MMETGLDPGYGDGPFRRMGRQKELLLEGSRGQGLKARGCCRGRHMAPGDKEHSPSPAPSLPSASYGPRLCFVPVCFSVL